MNVNGNEAAEALGAMQAARLRANGMKRLPMSYHLAIGAVMGGWVAIQGLERFAFGIGVLVLCALTAALYHWQRQATGRWVNGFRSGRTLTVALAMLLIVVGLLLTSNPRLIPDMALFTPLQGGIIAFFAAALLDWLWVKAYDADIRSGR